jgi:hypothetical protein
MSMTSNYNDHPRPAEVLVDGGEAVVINRRQPPAALLETELDPRLLAFEAPLEKAVQPKNR